MVKTIQVNPRELRIKCRCAACVDEMSNKSNIDESKIPIDIKPIKIIPKGTNSVAIVWSDGHKSSIYTYKMFFD